MQTLPAPREVILEQLDRILASDTFAGAERSRALLRFLVEQTLENHPDRLKEYTIGAEAFGRGDSFDPRTDPIVRAEASRLRSRLQQYYGTNGAADVLIITLPKGSYVPQFQRRETPAAGPVAATAGDASSTPDRFQRFIWFVLGGITIGVAAALFFWATSSDLPVPLAPEADMVDLPLSTADYSLGSGFGNDVILSPDGKRIVFVARGSDHVLRLMTHELGQLTADGLPEVDALRDTDGAQAPFFSPDSNWVAFWAGDRLKKVSVEGGSPTDLTEAIDFGGGAWARDDTMVLCLGSSLVRVSPSGEKKTITDLTEEDIKPRWPRLLPGDTHVLFTALRTPGPDASTIEVLPLSDVEKRTTLVPRATFGHYLNNGYLLYVNQGTLFAVALDLQGLEVRGPRVPVLQRVAYSPIFGFAQFDVSQNGKLIFRRSPPLVVSWLKSRGGQEPLLSKPGNYAFPRLSPDGRRLAINVTDSGVLRIDIYDLKQPERPTPLPPGSMSAAWNHDGRFLVVGSYDAGMSWMTVDGMSKLERLTHGPSVQIPWSFNRDGTRLAYCVDDSEKGLDLATIEVNESAGKLKPGKQEVFKQTSFFECAPSFSPDGKWLAYGWGPGNKWDVYVQPFPADPLREVKVSEGGGRIAKWLPNGRELVYRTDTHRLMVVEYEVKDGTFVAGKSKEWTPDRLADTGVIPNFDVDPQGDRILGVVPASREEDERLRRQVTVKPRFLDEVRARLSASAK